MTKITLFIEYVDFVISHQRIIQRVVVESCVHLWGEALKNEKDRNFRNCENFLKKKIAPLGRRINLCTEKPVFHGSSKTKGQ